MKFLIIQLGRIGDMILATPMFHAMKSKYPDSEIHVLAGRSNNQIIKDMPDVSKIFILDKSPLKLMELIFKLNREKYDYLIDPKDHLSTESHFLARLIGVKNKIGLNKGSSKIYNIPIQEQDLNKGLHYTLRCIKALNNLDIQLPTSPVRPVLFPNKDSESYTDKFFSNNEKIILINISASNQNKMWDNDKWIELIDVIKDYEIDDNLSFVLIYSPENKSEAEYILSNQKKLKEFKSRSINDAISMIKRSKLLITPDTSLVHIASAFNIPIIGLYSGLDNFYEKFHPTTDVFEVIRSEKGIDGIKEITVPQIYDVYTKMIKLVLSN